MISGIFTSLAFVGFLGITWWAYARHNRARFDEAAALPLIEDEQQPTTEERAPCCREKVA